ncbi:MAG: SDR family oxidoreductase [Actinobacteria bacterium]|nr:SDR family oxidoreductase [Actinomycetota bacterium]
MTQLLEGKNAIIYGGSGSIGRGVARTFAREGATLFLVGRTQTTLEAVADDIASGGGRAHVAVVDTLDELAVAEHARSVVDQAGSIDVSFNLTSRGDVQGTPLLDMQVEDFLHPTTTGLRSNFITARATARHMVQQGSGVILMLTSGSGPAWTPPDVWPMGGTGPADAATESFMRYLASEVGPRGVRVVCLWTAGVVIENDALGAAKNMLVGMSMLRKRPTLQEVADTATFLASDRGSGITASIVNVTSGISAL